MKLYTISIECLWVNMVQTLHCENVVNMSCWDRTLIEHAGLLVDLLR